MHRFQELLLELKQLAASAKAGHPLTPPASLSFVEHEGRKIYYASMGPLESPGLGLQSVSAVVTDSSLDAPQRATPRDTAIGLVPGHIVPGKVNSFNIISNETPAVILVHGFGGFFMDWPRVMTPISRHAPVYALDLPGWGFSDANSKANALEDDVLAVDALIKALKLKNVILCGLSYGGGVAWAAAAMRISSVREIVLLNPMPTYPLSFMKSKIYQGIFLMAFHERLSRLTHRLLAKHQYKIICKESLLNFRLLDTFYLDLAFKVIKQPKLASVLHLQARGARTVDWAAWEHRLAGIRVPVTILQAREDRLFSLASAKHLQSLIPNAQLIEVERCGHAMVFDQHRKISEHIISRLRSAKKLAG